LYDPFPLPIDATLQKRLSEANDFYKSLTPERAGEDEALVMRQALAGMLWTKQYFFFDVSKRLEEHGPAAFMCHYRDRAVAARTGATSDERLARTDAIFGLAYLLGIQLLPWIRDWKGKNFYRPS
jgi:hypothetical protein